jgi:mono/diheme cytochrome c family protein
MPTHRLAVTFGLAFAILVGHGARCEDAANGRRLYLADGCYECHGRMGQGGAYLGGVPMLTHTQLPLDGVKQVLRQPYGDMPAYAETVLSDKDVDDIYAFLQSLPAPPQPSDLPEILKH